MSRSLLETVKPSVRRHGRSSCTRRSRLSIPHRRLLCEPLEDRRLLTMLAFQDKLLSQEVPQGNDEFGNAVAVDGDTLVVASRLRDVAGLTDAGAAYVFVRDDQGTPDDESDDRWAFQTADLTGEMLFDLRAPERCGLEQATAGGVTSRPGAGPKHWRRRFVVNKVIAFLRGDRHVFLSRTSSPAR